MHTEPGILGVTTVILAALLLGLGMVRLRQPAVLGYILAGVVLGPSGLGLVEDREGVALLAELGVLMLLFIVGAELDLRRFMDSWTVAVGTLVIQVGAGIGMGLGLMALLGWSFPLAILAGFAFALSSTAVVIKMLEQSGELTTATGRIAVGVLIAQDIAVVPMMLVLAVLSDGVMSVSGAASVVGSIVFMAGLFWILTHRQINIPVPERLTSHVDLGPLIGLAVCFGAATLSGVMGLSPAYGAFLAGVVIGSSTLRENVIRHTHPVQAVLLMVFFLSIGLLVDLTYLWNNLLLVLTLLLLVTVIKAIVNIGALRLMGQSWPRSVQVGVVLAQIGEFSFLLATLSAERGILDQDGARMMIAVTVLSLAFSPLWLLVAHRLDAVARRQIPTLHETLDIAFGPEISAAVQLKMRGVKRWRVWNWRRRKKKTVVPSHSSQED
ncbi:MAG: cation:proton antiporter [Rhodospirillaceae bacterium]